MPKGVKKIKLYKGMYYPDQSASLTTQVTIQPDQFVSFKVEEWLPDTTEAEKEEGVYWMRQSQDRRTIIYKNKAKEYQFKIGKKLCGPYSFYIEASRSGNRDFKNKAGIYVSGSTTALIKASDWRKTKNGEDIKNSDPIKYGELVYLWLETEGLNGDDVTIEIYNKALGSDDLIFTYTNVTIEDGEVFLKIGNTASWMAKVNNIRGIEKFCIKVKKDGKYIQDHLDDDIHAVYLNVKKELASAQTLPSENITATKVFKTEVNAERHDPCRFTEIKVTELKEKNGKLKPITISIFKDGQKREGQRIIKEYINRIINFNFNDASLRPDAQKKLNNILGFLLGHKGTEITMKGHACVIGDIDFNKLLSQQRSDAVKAFFVKGGLDARRMNSLGFGEFNVEEVDTIANRDKASYINSRKVDVSFTFDAHDANTLVYETVAGSEKYSTDLTIDITDFDTKDCFRDTDKHNEKVIIESDVAKEVTANGKKGILYPVFSTLPDQKDFFDANYYAALEYLWPSNAKSNEFYFFLNSCRYYSNKKKATLVVKTYPDIKWTLAFELAINISHKKFSNMPEGAIWNKHWKDAQPAGVARSLINRRNKEGKLTPKAGVPIKWGFGIEAEWNKKNSKRKFSAEIESKIRKFTDTVEEVAGVLDQASEWGRNAAEFTGLPITFDIIYPKVSFGISWYAEGAQKNGKLATVGEIGFAADPLIGAVGTVDLIAATIYAISIGTTGSPAVVKLYNKFTGIAENLGASVAFDAVFTGELFIKFPNLQIHSVNGIKLDGGFDLGGKFTMAIRLEISIEVGKIESSKKAPIIKISVSAIMQIGFGGSLKIDSDKYGVYIIPKVEFSGAKIVAEIKGEFGWWSWMGVSYTLEEVIIEPSSYTMDKTYISGS